MQFPNVDPIPIPAPVWLMKFLSLLTLALHFFAVMVLLGSLLAVIYLSLRAKSTKDPATRTAASVVAHRLPVIMTYVINLGVPPLLFLQVLYGRVIYTSTVLIGVMWISVILLLMACYWLLYKTAESAKRGGQAYWPAAGALLIAAGIGQIYSMAMTLMLRPEVWQEMYAKTATGLQAPPHDPTMMPRWLFIITGGLVVGGLWIILHSNVKTVEPATQAVLKKLGAVFAVLGVLVQFGVAAMVMSSQPESVKRGLGSPLYQISSMVWAVGAILALAIAGLHFARKASSVFLGWAGAVAAFVSIAGMVVYRDGIRDVTLMAKGFDVWKRTEVSNWSVIGLFLLLFVVGLGTVGWLLLVMKNATPVSEEVKA